MPCILAGEKPRVKTVGQPLLAVLCSAGKVERDSQPLAGAPGKEWLSYQAPHRLSAHIGTSYASRVSLNGSHSKLREILSKFAAIAGLVALLLPGVSPLMGALSAADLPACCNTIYCPLHHRQMNDLQKDKSNCDAAGMLGHNDCSMRACDAAPNPAVSITVIVLVTPLALRGPSVAEAATAAVFDFPRPVSTFPLTPPPRTFPS